MNLRKGLVAAATALTVSITGVSLAGAETPEEDTNLSSVMSSTEEDAGEDQPALSSLSSSDTNNDDEDASLSSDVEAGEVADWISVFTAVIGALSALFAFLNNF